MDGSISLRKDGRYMGRIYVNHVQKCVYGKSKQEVAIKLKELVKKTKVESNYFKMSLYQFSMQYLENYKKSLMKETSYRQRVYQVERWKDNKLFTKKIVNIVHKDLVDFFKNYDKNYLSYLILKEIFEKAKDIGVIDINPIALIAKPNHETIEDRVRDFDQSALIYSAQQIESLRESVVDKQLSMLFEVLLYTGIRIGEALALQKKDFDFTKKIVKIYKNYDYFKDELTTTKTKKGTRIIPLFNCLAEEVKPFLDDYGEEDFIFSIPYHQIAYECRQLTKKLGFKVGLHKFRKTFISICQFKLGISTSVVAQWVGHANVSTTIDTYSILTEEDNKKMVLTLN